MDGHTSYQLHDEDGFGLLLDQIAADIGRAPVEPWLKLEAIDRLDRIAQFVQATQKDAEKEQGQYPEENTLSELATPTPVDRSWQKLQIIESLARGANGVPVDIVARAKEVYDWVVNGDVDLNGVTEQHDLQVDGEHYDAHMRTNGRGA